MSKVRNGALDQYGAGPFEQQQFGTADVEGVNTVTGHRTIGECVRQGRLTPPLWMGDNPHI